MGKYKLSPNEEAQQIKEERDRRRIERILQVRDVCKEQSKEMCSSFKLAKKQKSNTLIGAVVNDAAKELMTKVKDSESEYERAVANIGKANKNAETLKYTDEAQESARIESAKLATLRYKKAVNRLLSNKSEKLSARENQASKRLKVQQAEAARSKQVVQAGRRAQVAFPGTPGKKQRGAALPIRLRSPSLATSRDRIAHYRHLAETLSGRLRPPPPGRNDAEGTAGEGDRKPGANSARKSEAGTRTYRVHHRESPSRRKSEAANEKHESPLPDRNTRSKADARDAGNRGRGHAGDGPSESGHVDLRVIEQEVERQHTELREAATDGIAAVSGNRQSNARSFVIGEPRQDRGRNPVPERIGVRRLSTLYELDDGAPVRDTDEVPETPRKRLHRQRPPRPSAATRESSVSPLAQRRPLRSSPQHTRRRIPPEAGGVHGRRPLQLRPLPSPSALQSSGLALDGHDDMLRTICEKVHRQREQVLQSPVTFVPDRHSASIEVRAVPTDSKQTQTIADAVTQTSPSISNLAPGPPDAPHQLPLPVCSLSRPATTSADKENDHRASPPRGGSRFACSTGNISGVFADRDVFTSSGQAQRDEGDGPDTSTSASERSVTAGEEERSNPYPLKSDGTRGQSGWRQERERPMQNQQRCSPYRARHQASRGTSGPLRGAGASSYPSRRDVAAGSASDFRPQAASSHRPPAAESAADISVDVQRTLDLIRSQSESLERQSEALMSRRRQVLADLTAVDAGLIDWDVSISSAGHPTPQQPSGVQTFARSKPTTNAQLRGRDTGQASTGVTYSGGQLGFGIGDNIRQRHDGQPCGQLDDDHYIAVGGSTTLRQYEVKNNVKTVEARCSYVDQERVSCMGDQNRQPRGKPTLSGKTSVEVLNIRPPSPRLDLPLPSSSYQPGQPVPSSHVPSSTLFHACSTAHAPSTAEPAFLQYNNLSRNATSGADISLDLPSISVAGDPVEDSLLSLERFIRNLSHENDTRLFGGQDRAGASGGPLDSQLLSISQLEAEITISDTESVTRRRMNKTTDPPQSTTSSSDTRTTVREEAEMSAIIQRYYHLKSQ